MLRVEGLTAGYGAATVLRGVTFSIPTGSVHLLSGPNGAGKTTLLHAVAGLLSACDGAVRLDGVPLHRLPAHRRARAGLALVPQGARVFGSLTVAEHLAVAARPGRWTAESVLDALPALWKLRDRAARRLSGGEQQLLAIARALATNASLLLLDEPTEGLAPTLVPVVTRLMKLVAAQGGTVLATEAHSVRSSPAGRPLAETRLSIRERE